jgi:hypothetical protein
MVSPKWSERIVVERPRPVRQLHHPRGRARSTFDLRNLSNITIDNGWIERQVVGVWRTR